jgi:diguanylate cyclase (GGDEF)-like protein
MGVLNKKTVSAVVALIYAVVFALSAYYYLRGGFESIEARLIDANFNRRGAVAADNKILIVGFTDGCMAAIGKWPWKRDVHAGVIDKLSKAGAKVIAVDVLFQDRSAAPGDDDALIKTLSENKNIVLSSVISPKTIYQDGAFINTRHVITPFGDLAGKSGGDGFISVNYDALNPDGILRSVSLADTGENNKIINSFALQVAGVSGLSELKAAPGEKYYLNYYGPAKTYEYITFSKVFSGELGMSYFKDKIVLIGPLATALGDLHHTPYGTMPGTEVQANILNCILSNSFLKRLPPAAVLLICALAMGLCFLLLVRRGIFYSGAACLFSLIFLLTGNYIMFSKFNRIMDIIPSGIALLLSFFIAALFFSYSRLMISNAHLNKKVRELNALYSISQNISELINLDKILKDVLNEAISVIGAKRGSLMLIDEDEQKLEVKVVAGIEGPVDKKILIPIGEGIAGQVFSDAVPIVSNAIEGDERFKNFSEYGGQKDETAGIKKILCVPLLISEKKTIGVINIVNKTDGSNFSPDDVKLMETISRHAATLIENSKLYKLATVDGMTGLYVHRYFQVRFKEEFSRSQRYNKNISALMTDIDHFKKFNDTYGHQCGDMVLAHVARIVRETIRNIDIAARYGGEEFSVALPETDAEGAYKLAERIRKNVEETACPTPKGDLKVTISLGVACNMNSKAPTHLALIACADSALYKSKEGGRNRVTVFSGEEAFMPEDEND